MGSGKVVFKNRNYFKVEPEKKPPRFVFFPQIESTSVDKVEVKNDNSCAFDPPDVYEDDPEKEDY